MQFSVGKVMQIWSGWEIRVLVLLSLSFQIILILFGSRRKYIAKSWIKYLVWSAYLAADWAATLALGNLATNQGDSGDQPSYNLQAFWAPFLLLHLGGPDTITAYSLEDNELWLRHLLGLVVQVEVAFYIFVRSWSNNALTFIAIPVFVAGVIKYGERTFVLWSSSIQRFTDSILSTVDPSPSLIRMLMKVNTESPLEATEDPLEYIGLHELHAAHFLFKRFSHLFAGLHLSYLEAYKSTKIFHQKSAKEAFNLVSIELGFMYDVLYTKATNFFSRLGIFLRFVTFCSSVSTLVAFSIIVDIHHYSLIEISVTYVLLVGAIVLEVYTLILHFWSDWTNLALLVKFRNEEPTSYGAKCLHYQSLLTKHKRWAASMGQFNLLSYCLKDMPSNFFKFSGIQKLVSVIKFLERSQYMTSEDVNLDLLEIIYKETDIIRQESPDHFFRDLDELGRIILARRGDHVLEKYNIDLADQTWFTSKREFDESLLIWHIATDICYHQDFDKHGEEIDNSHPRCKISRCLSNYMLYLQVLCPSMMPKGIGELRFTETCHQVLRVLKLERSVIPNRKDEACKLLFERKPLFKSYVDDEKMSVLYPVVVLVSNLQSLESKDDWGLRKKWEMMSEVWVEMLMHAASHCDWKEHGQQLGRGGELLTHVCLLMAHTGRSAQYDVYGNDFA